MTTDPTTAALQQAIDALRTHNWSLAFFLGLMLSIWLLRALGSRLPGKLGALCASTRGGVAINITASFLGTVVTSLLAHRSLSDAGLWVAALNGSIGAAGGWAVLKGIFFPSDADPLHQIVLKGMRKPAGPAVALAMLGTLFALAGCGATGQMIRTDLKADCGGDYAKLEPIVLQGLTTAAAGGEAAVAIFAAVALANLPVEVSAVWCTIKVVVADLEKKAAAAPKGKLGAKLQHQLDVGHQLLRAYVPPSPSAQLEPDKWNVLHRAAPCCNSGPMCASRS
jgi:hypothetical protein